MFFSKKLEKNDPDLIETDKDCIIKVLDFLKEFKMEDPIEFLKVNFII